MPIAAVVVVVAAAVVVVAPHAPDTSGVWSTVLPSCQ
jgi:hypothetical protein